MITNNEHRALVSLEMCHLLEKVYRQRKECDLQIALLKRYIVELNEMDVNEKRTAFQNADIESIAALMRGDTRIGDDLLS